MKHYTFLNHRQKYIYHFLLPALIAFYTSFKLNFITIELKAPVQGNEDNPYAASEFRYNMIAGKNNLYSVESRNNAILHLEKYNLNTKELAKGNSISSWSPLGPGNIGGRIRSIIIKPSNPNHILIGAVSGGIWKTTDGGLSWNSKTDVSPILSIGCMVKDVSNENIIYAGTGEGWGNIDAVTGGGIYKSTDFGESWTLLSSTMNTWNFKNIIKMDFDNLGNVYAVTKAYNWKYGGGGYYINGNLYKSTNGGTSWTSIGSGATNYFNGSDVAIINSNVIVFATKENGSTLGGIYKTTNGGTNWNKVSSGLPNNGYSRISISKDPNNINNLYAVFEATSIGAPDYGLKGIYKSTNAGDSWTELTKPSNLTSTGRSYLGAQGWYNNVVSIDPFNSNNIYVGGVEVMKSTNGGSSWNQISYWHTYYGTPYVHADHHAIVFHPTTQNIVYDGNDGGIYKTTNAGTSWNSLNNNLAITQFYGGAVSNTGNVFQGGTQDNGHLSYNSGMNWTQVEGGDGGYAAIDQNNSNICYEEYVYLDLAKSTNGGTIWVSATNGLTDAQNGNLCLFISPFSMNPENSNVLIAGSDKVWVTSNSASNWYQSSNSLGASISAVTIVNASANFLGFAGTSGGKVFRCTSLNPASGIDTWSDITPTGNNGAWVRRIAVDPNNKNNIYAAYSGYNNGTNLKHIYYSSDQGNNWTDISGDLPDVPVHSIVVDNITGSKLYIGTELGIFQTTNRGTNWIYANSGMPYYSPVDELVLQSGTNLLYAFTHGRGVFVTTSPLPVELESFSAKNIANKVAIVWSTATELNSNKFVVERSTINENNFNKIGEVKANGNSSSRKQYEFQDEVTIAGKYNYRLKMIDNDGAFKYSNSIQVDVKPPDKYALLQNYPNPFNSTTIISYQVAIEGPVKIILYDINGKELTQLINEIKSPGVYKVKLNADNFASGIYFYSLQTENLKITKKMLLIK